MKTQLLSRLEQAKNYTLSVAEMMPEALYHFKPADPIWNFKELMHHIGYGLHWYGDNYLKKKDTAWMPPLPTEDKTETMAYLDAAFDALQVDIAHKQQFICVATELYHPNISINHLTKLN
ncbi:DinB family protein [Pedobacter caeni]|uniref:DinB superfamily protein n=1 Tax=Pedobacter caeni TaxID=288992 RepID=A0A1M4WC80_9SPHI|nr:DinB family protein [Pedobacter caeni]SHE78785.1 DinB superfamily protein [Pedobacter caeni]